MNYLIVLITWQVCKSLEGRCVDESVVARFSEECENGSCIYVLNLNHLVF